MPQFIGKPFWIILGSLAAIFVVAMFVLHSWVSLPILIAVMIGAFALTVKKLEWGIVLAFAELFANSHGHLIEADLFGFPLSLREVIFIGVLAGWLYIVVTKRATLAWKDARLTPFLVLAAAVAIGFVIGFLQNDKGDAFADGNAYAYIAYILPILSVRWDATSKRLLFQTLAASAVWISAVSLGLLYIFTHIPSILAPVYTFIRDTRTGELTNMCQAADGPTTGALCGIFRVFLQAQISVIVAIIFVSPMLWFKGLSKKHTALLVTGLSLGMGAIIISMSRSFWLAMIVCAPVYLVLMFIARKPSLITVARVSVLQALTLPIGALFVVAAILFPIPNRISNFADLSAIFSSRTTGTGDVAISSRWNLLPPLVDEIKSSPIVGSGFGESITFKTDDPRARAINPDGTWTTYALEWGWFEIWLKMGILGILAFAWLFVSQVRGLLPLLKTEHGWIAVAGISTLVMLYATHVFSPYLNHPLGLGILLFLVPFLQTKIPALTEIPVREEIAVPIAQVSMASFTSE